MVLRDYQQECIDIVDTLPDGAKSVVAVATGLGKTVIGAHIRFKGRMLWLSHRDELVRQPEKYFAEQGYTFGVEKAEEHEQGEDVISASVQSLYRDERLNHFPEDAFDIIVCDEAHHAAAPTYKKILGYFKPRKLIGLTATPQRGDKVRLDDVFDDICFSKDLKWGIENGYLSRIRCIRVQANFDMNKVDKKGGDFTLLSLENQMRGSDDDIVVTRAYLDYCVPGDKQTLIYCPTVKVCMIVEKTLKEALPESEQDTVRILTQKTPDNERHDILQAYRERKVKCIINCMILTEGTDLPETSVIINNRPSANSTLYQQIIGRGTRLSEGKEYCLIIDVVGEHSAFKSICTAPTLFGINMDLVPEEARKKMENEDLLEISEAFSKERARTAKQTALAVQMIDIFTLKKTAIITGMVDSPVSGNMVVSARSAADRYSCAVDEENNKSDYDFGDVLVKIQPDDRHYYKIKPTYEGEIFLSKPDFLGNTVIDIKIPCNELPGSANSFRKDAISCISPLMKMDKAKAFIEDVLTYAIPEHFAFKWSKNAREELRQFDATEKQTGRIWHAYTERGYNIKGTKALNRTQACDLIDLDIEMKELKEQKDMLEKQAAQENKTRKGKNLEKWLKKQELEREEEERLEQDRKDQWEPCREHLLHLIEQGRKDREKKERELKKLSGEGIVYEIKIDYQFFKRGTDPSEKQEDFISSLVSQIATVGGRFNKDPRYIQTDKWGKSCLINTLIWIKDNHKKASGYITIYDIDAFCQDIDKIRTPYEVYAAELPARMIKVSLIPTGKPVGLTETGRL